MCLSASRRLRPPGRPALLFAAPAPHRPGLRRLLRRSLPLVALLAALLAAVPARAQEAARAGARPAAPVVVDVAFAGNGAFSDAVLALQVRTRPNRRFLDIPGLTWWLWTYRLGASSALPRRLGDALMATGEAPAYLDASVLAADVERLNLFYRQEGYRSAQVTVEVDTLAGGAAARVTFRVARGAPVYLRSVAYDGLDVLTPEQRRRLRRGSALGAAVPDTALAFRVDGRRYSEPDLLEERRRLLTLLRREGYATVGRDSIRAIVYPHTPDSFDVVFRVRPGPRYRFGDVHFDVTGPEDAAVRTDTFRVADAADGPGGRVTVRIADEAELEPRLLLRALQFTPGAWYDAEAVLATKRRLEATGVFAFTDITPLTGDTLTGDTLTGDTLTGDTFAVGAPGALRLAHRIEARTRRRHNVRLESFMLNRSGVLSGADDELATGLGVTYENLNLFGGAEALSIRTTGSVAADLTALALDSLSAQAETAVSLVLPYLVAPFGGLERGLYDARTRLSLSLLTARRDDLFLRIRGRGTARLRLELTHRPRLASLVDVLDVSLSNPDTLAGFRAVFLDAVLGPPDDPRITDPVQRAQIEEDYTRPQVNSAFRYTLRSSSVHPLRRDRGYAYEGTFELGGNAVYLLDRFVFTPDTLEGSLPGLPIFSSGRSESRLGYRQYVRLLGDLRRYRPVGRSTVLAGKFAAGLAHPVGRADLVPFDRRFYAGGGASVRGWELRTLGPGALSPTGADAANLLGGDVKLEASLELRRTLLRGLFGADWIAVAFADAGNVWFGPRSPGAAAGRFRLGTFYEEIGVGSGLGLRIGWEYLIVRLDAATRVHDPAVPGFFPSGSFSTLHFGIGHAF